MIKCRTTKLAVYGISNAGISESSNLPRPPPHIIDYHHLYISQKSRSSITGIVFTFISSI